MHTVDLMEEARQAAESLGYGIREEYLGGVGGGPCEIAGRKWIFVDLALTTQEQFTQIIDAIREDRGAFSLVVSTELQGLLGFGERRAAA